MKKRIVEIAVKVVVAALTAFLTAISTTSCMGLGPITLRNESAQTKQFICALCTFLFILYASIIRQERLIYIVRVEVTVVF